MPLNNIPLRDWERQRERERVWEIGRVKLTYRRSAIVHGDCKIHASKNPEFKWEIERYVRVEIFHQIRANQKKKKLWCLVIRCACTRMRSRAMCWAFVFATWSCDEEILYVAAWRWIFRNICALLLLYCCSLLFSYRFALVSEFSHLIPFYLVYSLWKRLNVGRCTFWDGNIVLGFSFSFLFASSFLLASFGK